MTRIQKLHIVLTSLNLAFAIAIALISCLTRKPLAFVHGNAISPDSFHKILIMLNSHFGRALWDPLGAEIALIGLAFLLFVVLFFVMRVAARTQADYLLTSVAGIAAICAVPVAWFPYDWKLGTYSAIDPRSWYVLVLELSVIGGALYLTRRRPAPWWFAILAIHYSACAWFLFQRAWPSMGTTLNTWWPPLASLVSPCAGFVWAQYVRHESLRSTVARRPLSR